MSRTSELLNALVEEKLKQKLVTVRDPRSNQT
jgi:hypothetical protein